MNYEYGTVVVKKENSIWNDLSTMFFRDDCFYVDDNSEIVIEFENPEYNNNEMSDRNSIIDACKLNKSIYSLNFISDYDNEYFKFYTYRDFFFMNKGNKKIYRNYPHQKFFYEKNNYYDLPESFRNYHKLHNMNIITTIYNNCYQNNSNEFVFSMCCNTNGENYSRISFEYSKNEFTREEISFIIYEIMKKYAKYN
jgi:hypothetical protein